ncbi:MAG TPA: helix-turn-helix domain-containing protein [Alphaproteobacteria bacterium]|nr:helix-turn-helix domain-containing protein [Alphaproteobacteria bacterium]
MVHERLLTPEEVAVILGVSPETLNVWRATKRYALPYVKAGRLVRYKLEDVEAFIQANTQRPLQPSFAS